MLTMDALRRWVVAGPEDEEDLLLAQAAAEGYLRGADVPEGDDPLRDMAILQLTTYYYEHRAADARGVFPPPPPALQSMILQLRYGEGAKV